MICRRLSSQCQCSKSIHDKIHPQKLQKQKQRGHQQVHKRRYKCVRERERENLNSIQWYFTRGNSRHNVNDQCCNIDSQLELDEFLNICIYRTTPSNNLHQSSNFNFIDESALDNKNKKHHNNIYNKYSNGRPIKFWKPVPIQLFDIQGKLMSNLKQELQASSISNLMIN